MFVVVDTGELSLVAQEHSSLLPGCKREGKPISGDWNGNPVVLSRLTTANMMDVHLVVNEDASPMTTTSSFLK